MPGVAGGWCASQARCVVFLKLPLLAVPLNMQVVHMQVSRQLKLNSEKNYKITVKGELIRNE